jgi:hypothetical protein
MAKINPSVPLGRYPHPLLYGHVGTEPSSNSTRMMININPIADYLHS